jgi:NADPH-dependent glutamate synthase beta subunit-like oxidoreductase
VGINNLKRFVCDYEMNQDKRIQPYKAPPSGKKIAVIGGGVEGLSAAFFSARLGHDATVFETTDRLGGILRVAIARERLSMEVLDWDIQGIVDMGVEMKTGQEAGRDFTIPQLLGNGFDAVFTATGGWDSRLSRGGVNKADMVFPGTYLLIDLLRSVSEEKIVVDCKKKVVIAGGGIQIPHAAEILRSKGAENIIVVSRKKAKDSSFDAQGIEKLSQQGVTIIYNAGITKVMGKDAVLTGIEYVALDTGEKHVIDTDTLIIGSGRFPELVFIPAGSDVQENETGEKDEPLEVKAAEAGMPLIWEGVELQKKPDANREYGLLSEQDAISEYSSAVAAINGGRQAAAAMHHLMYGLEFQNPVNMITKISVLQDVKLLNHVPPSPRNLLDIETSSDKRKDRFSTGFSLETAKEEANRCLQCGLVCYEKPGLS